jgi:hypothetical protein
MRFPVLAASVLFLVCSACEPASSPGDLTIALETEDPRFEIFLDRSPSGPEAFASPAIALHLRIQPKAGWHIEPDAPTRLDLNPVPGIEVDSPLPGSPAEVASSADKIEFKIAYRIKDEGKRNRPGLSFESRLKFGVCRNGNLRCEIVNREIQIPIH